MSKEVLSSLAEAYPKWSYDLIAEFKGTRLLSEEQMKEMLRRKNLPPQLHKKKNKPGIEDCIEYEDERFLVQMYTSYVATEKAFRKNDNGWVLLFDKRYPNDPAFFSFPMRRTKGFLHRLRKWFKAFWEITQHWHLPCEICKKDPTIRLVRGDVLHAVAYFCINGHSLTSTTIYAGISEESRTFIAGYFERYEKYQKKNQESGTVRTPDRFLRAGRKTKSQDDGVYYGDGEHNEW